jgi:hypothetical protein
MDFPAAWFETCACGRTFSVPQAFTYHKRSCDRTKKRLAVALDKAKDVWQAKKRQKTQEKTAAQLEPTRVEAVASASMAPVVRFLY